jgi:O-antigen ligase
MSGAPLPARGGSAREVRDAARRQARSFPAGLVVLFSMGIAALAITVFVLLDYRFGQDPHRIVKLLLGVVLIGGILVQPQAGLWLLPVGTPFLGWMPKLPIPGINPLNVLVFSVFSSFALARVMNRQPIFRKGSLSVLLGVLVLVASLSVVRGAAVPTGYTFHVREAVMALIRSSMTFTIYFIALAMVRGERHRRALAWAIVLGLLAEAAVTIVYGRNGRGERAIGSFGQSNELGAFLAMFTAFSAALLGGTRRWFGRLVLLGATLGGTAAVMLSVSRGALVALAVGLFYVAVRSSKVLALLLVVAALSAPLWIPDYMMDRLTGTQVEDSETGEVGLEGSAQLRLDTWRAILDVVTDHPLDGVGFTGLGYVLPETGDALGVEVKDSAHNTYLRFLGEMGIFGLGLFVWLLWKCWKLSADGVKQAATRFDRQLAVGVGAATLAMAISCAFGDRFFSILITGNFWLACALVDDARLERARRAA